MTDQRWKYVTAVAAFPLSYAAYTGISHIPGVGYWQTIALAACTTILTLEYADHIRERKRQNRDHP